MAALHPYLGPALRYAGWFAIFLVVAPVIGPRGYGLFMLALSGVAIAEVLLAETATQALVGLATVDDRHWSTALATMIVAGGAVWLALRAGAPLLDELVADPEFPDMFRSLAVLPLLGGLSVVPVAALRREGREGMLLAASLAGLAAGGGIALSLAWAGAGPWSLVAQIIVQRLVECIVLWSLPAERVGLAWSAPHFTDLAEAVDGRACAAIWPAVRRYAPCLVVGLALGPTAAGLYMLAAMLAEAFIEVGLAGAEDATPRAAMRRGCRILLPAVMASGLLANALPPLIDLRWWGAIEPAQLLLLGAIPAAFGYRCAARAEGNGRDWSRQAMQALGGIAIVALLARDGLVAVAAGNLVWLTVMGFAALRPQRRHLAAQWRNVTGGMLRPCGGAALAGLFLFFLANPIGLALAPVPALSLLSGGAWLIYLTVRGDPAGPGAPRALLAPET
jgi:polysaccharide biosynthesis protein